MITSENELFKLHGSLEWMQVQFIQGLKSIQEYFIAYIFQGFTPDNYPVLTFGELTSDSKVQCAFFKWHSYAIPLYDIYEIFRVSHKITPETFSNYPCVNME
jgi:hypothetical protein